MRESGDIGAAPTTAVEKEKTKLVEKAEEAACRSVAMRERRVVAGTPHLATQAKRHGFFEEACYNGRNPFTTPVTRPLAAPPRILSASSSANASIASSRASTPTPLVSSASLMGQTASSSTDVTCETAAPCSTHKRRHPFFEEASYHGREQKAPNGHSKTSGTENLEKAVDETMVIESQSERAQLHSTDNNLAMLIRAVEQAAGASHQKAKKEREIVAVTGDDKSRHRPGTPPTQEVDRPQNAPQPPPFKPLSAPPRVPQNLAKGELLC
jgi:hypothetical protein